MRRIHTYLIWMTTASLILVGCAAPPLPSASERAPMPVLQVSETAVESERNGETTLTAAQTELLASLDGQGPAPELHNETWLNSEPLRLADLRGKVVIVEFWTYG